jgi:hypothetical protein
MVMSLQEISFISQHARFILVLLMVAGSSFVLPVSHLVYAHTFSTSESAEFLSLTDQIRAESALVIMNLENNNATLAQAHAEKASSLLNNDTLGEIRERNNRIANSLETGLKELVGNVSSFASASPGQTMPQDRLQNINQIVMSLNDTMAEAITTRVESDQQKNVTTWAMALADLVNVVLSDYGNATGSSFDLTDMSNMAAANTTTTSPTTSNMTTTTATIVDTAAYQSAQYLVNNTILQLFNDTLKPLTISSGGTPSNNNATTMTQEGQGTSPAAGNMTSSNIDKLEAGLMQLKDDINSKATPNEVMITAHLNINPLLMQTYGLTLEQEGQEEEQHSGNGEGH